jgi:EmrB/QacA subfamily drug resistance transporter
LMDITIVNVAILTLSTELNAPNTTIEWVVTGYLLSLAIWIPASGWLGDRFGTKRIFLLALGIFTIGSLMCSLSPNVESLIVFRVIQGVGGGMLTPVGVTMLFRAFPPHERAEASSILSIAAAMAPAIGPVLGGWLVDFANWRWIFLVNVPIGIFTFFFSLSVLKEYRQEVSGKFDIAGFLLSAIGLVLLLYALSTVPTRGPESFDVILTSVLGIAVIALLVWVESRLKAPILHFSLFRERLFRTANIVMFFAFSLWIGFLFVLPLFLQEYIGLSAFQSGLTTSPQAVGWIAVATFASRVYHRVGPRRMITIGLIGTTLLTLVFVWFNAGTDLWWMRVVLFFRGFTMGFAVIPVQAAVFTNISHEETGRASSLFNTNRQVASSFGTAILGTVLFELLLHGTQGSAGKLFAYHVSFIAAVAMGVVAIAFALTIKDKDAEASVKRQGRAGGETK